MHDRKVLWTTPSTAIELAAAEEVSKPLADEIATRARCDYFSMLASLPDPDMVLRRLGHDMRIYEEQLADPRVASCFARRKAGTKKRLWEIDKGSAKSKHAKFIEDVFKRRPLKLPQAISQILDASYYGYQPLEITWESLDGAIVPVKVEAKPPRWFAFGQKNELLLRTKQNYFGEPLPDRKFLLAQNDPRYENPYGKKIASQIFWYCVFKKNGLKWWVKFVEKFGIPFIMGKLPRGTETSETNDLLSKLAAMINDAVAVVPDDASVELLSAKDVAGSTPQHQSLIDYCDKSISLAFLGHSGAADSTPGKLGGEDVSASATADIIDADSELVMQTLNDLIDWTIELNFGPDAIRPTFNLYDEDKVQIALATRDKTLSDTQQIKFTKKYFMTNYNFDEDDIVVAEPPAQPPAAGTKPGAAPDNGAASRPAAVAPGDTAADGNALAGGTVQLAEPAASTRVAQVDPSDQKDVNDFLDSLSADDLQKQIEGPLKPVIELIDGAASYESVLEQIAKVYPQMNDAEFEKTITKAMFLADLKGRMAAGTATILKGRSS